MKHVVEVRVLDKNRTYDTNGLTLKIGDRVIVETEDGKDFGKVHRGPKEAIFAGTGSRKVLRKMNNEDMEQIRENRKLEGRAYDYCRERIEEYELPMKLISVYYQFDNSKAIFYFSAQSRVDFRELVKDLARKLHSRIEMRQIKSREEAQILSGIGPCGQEVCCATSLCKFQPVSLKMGKDQDIALNPDKITGICGRLLCCLAFEQKNYIELREKLPRFGKKVSTPSGPGKVVGYGIIEQKVKVEMEDGSKVLFDNSEVKEKGILGF